VVGGRPPVPCVSEVTDQQFAERDVGAVAGSAVQLDGEGGGGVAGFGFGAAGHRVVAAGVPHPSPPAA
jgi:hypothetical protein